MRGITEYISEAQNITINEMIKKLSSSETGLIVFDIDDTILKSNPKNIKVYKRVPGSDKEIPLSTEEFAKDPDTQDPAKKKWFDYREFNDPKKVYDSIITGTPLIKNLRIMDSYIEAGYDFCFLTARGCEEVIKDALDNFLLKRNRATGALEELGDVFKKSLSHAINDLERKYPGKSDGERKANVLKDLCSKYDKVIFVDDDDKNLKAAREIGLKNLKVIKAWQE